jgi:hypothetical protein
MQEHGVSKIVSVKFHKSGEEAGDFKPVPLDNSVARAPRKVSDGPPVPEEQSDDVVLAK